MIKKLKKWYESTRVLERMDVFLTKYGHESRDFFREKSGEKKGHPFDFFGLYCSVVLTEVTFFWTKYGHDSRGFFMKIWKKNDIRTPCFWGNGRVFYKIGQDSSEFFWRKEGFLTKYGHESSYFFVKNRRKNKASWFFWSIIYRSFDRIDVSWPKRAWQHEVFHKKSGKKWHENCIFERKVVLLTKYMHERSVFFRE